MPGSLQIRRSRRSARGEGSNPLVVVLSLILALVAGLGLIGASAYLAVVRGLPDVVQVEAQFGMRGAETFRPLLVFDSSGEHVLYRHLHPDAQSRQWIDPESSILAQAIVAAVEPDYWSSPGFDLSSQTASTISERLVEIALLPPGEPSLTSLAQRSLLAAELTRRYPRERILTWYLNSADYGDAAYGIDSAALARYGKHAEELSLGESASLAALLDSRFTELDAEAGRERVLEAMVDADFITPAQARSAQNDPLPSQVSLEIPGFATYLIEEVSRELGEAVVGRSGLKVISTIDYDLQQQTACAAESHVLRLSGEPIGTVSATSDGSPCVSAALLPTLRPLDAGFDHKIEDWALVVIDPVSGEILAAQGPFDKPRNPETLLDPFTYLTAFSRGSTPSSMVVDLGDEPHGPVRMRTALANIYPDAAETTLAALGQESVARTLSQLGMSGPRDSASLIELTSTYGVLAAEGKRTGADPDPDPTLVLRVEDSDGNVLHEYSPHAQAAVSPQLAFLMVDALSDESVRWEELGKGNNLEIGRTAGAISGSSPEGNDNWAIGFTPQRVVGVWLGGSPLIGVNRSNGAAAIWNAAIRFASADLPPVSWQMPLGVTEVEVCNPSGLLPTQYCPEIVREVFILGTEPTQYDDLYRPFRVNRETGKLATLLTPLQSIEERVYFIPPPAAEAWAIAMGIERPPEEYDTLSSDPGNTPGIQIMSPAPFDVLGDNVAVRGDANTEGFDYYRLQYGRGLNPTRWIQIGSDQGRPVEGSRLGTWPTEDLNGLYTLQLLVVLNDGQVRTAALPVTLDNEPPRIELLVPSASERYSLGSIDELTISVSALDEVGLDRVEFFAGGRRIGTATSAPYSMDWTLPNRTGEYEIIARAYDTAGNRAESQRIQIEILP